MARLDAEQRKRMIVAAAVKIANEKGLEHVTHGAVAKRCPIQTSQSTVRHYFEKQLMLQKACVVEDDSLMLSALDLGII